MLIDSHLAELILNPEASALVRDLRGLLERHIALATALGSLKGTPH